MFLLSCIKSYLIGWLIGVGAFIALGVFVQNTSFFYAILFAFFTTVIGSVAIGLYKNKIYLDRLKKELEAQQQKDAEKNQVKYVIIK